MLQPYQVERLTGFLNPDTRPERRTYNAAQSITAVGSGGLDGRGVANATQTNLNYLPEHSTDFIFSSLAEQRGFLGGALLLLLYGLVVWRGLRTISIAPSLFTAVVAAGIVMAFTMQVFVNVGMTIGIAPITGIPLPVRQLRRQLDDRHARDDRVAPGDPRPRQARRPPVARVPVRPVPVLAFRGMMLENIGEADEALAIEEADAWFEYLEAVRSHAATDRYDEVEPWAWSRLTQRLRLVEAERGRLRPAAA